MAPVARVCLLCPGMHLADDRHHDFDHHAVEDACGRHFGLLYDSHWVMRLFIWQPNQNGLTSCFLLNFDKTDELPA